MTHRFPLQTAQPSRQRRLADSNCWNVPLEPERPSQIQAVRDFVTAEKRPLVTPELGYRLASLADGEGCFTIAPQRKRGRTTYSCAFAVKLRADDEGLLLRCQQETGLGRVYRGVAQVNQARRNNPNAAWRVQRIDECLALVAIFEAFPLWSKKARDFEVWARAVRYWAAPNLTPRTGRGRQSFVDHSPLADLHAELREARRFAA